uniref:Retrovirus-related Pol polyprotein from transposon TNT 1-94 n=1 Tax=Cajanus cajan TaxID=3821 RepID=A0A151SYW8_CAJCA|nr:Retrovirus-related Pol polyprotein from transposon TNT 1-94 [Cajanus cajan]
MATQTSNSGSKDVWYVDSGCPNHMVRDSSLFTSLDKAIQTKVKLGNGDIVQVEGRGTIFVHTSKGPKFIHDVLFIPDLDQNLLSVAQLLKKGYSFSSKNNGCIILDSNDYEVIKVEMCDNSFPISLNQVHESTLFPNMMISFSSTNVTQAKEKLELIHTNLCGPMSVSSLSQNKYFLLFIDDLTRMTWVYFLRFDNGKENTSNEFNVFCKDMDIVHKLTVSYSPKYRVYNMISKQIMISKDIQINENSYWD